VAASSSAGDEPTPSVPVSPGRNQKKQRSTERILTTHVGSLPRPDDLFELMLARMDGNASDEQAYAERVRSAVKDCVRQQVDAGLDVVSDGEMAKPSFITYAASRLSGLEKREGFRPSPFANRASNVEATTPNEYYLTPEAYVFAVTAPRARMGRLAADQNPGRQNPDPGHDHAVDRSGGASRAGGAAHRAVRRDRRARARHRWC
jgi:cobalamin-independent methionine synthase catalytic subunit